MAKNKPAYRPQQQRPAAPPPVAEATNETDPGLDSDAPVDTGDEAETETTEETSTEADAITEIEEAKPESPMSTIHTVTNESHPTIKSYNPAEAHKAIGPTVMMMFPVAVNLLHAGIMHKFGKGRSPVPKDLADHWYLKANGAELVG